jgi:hypothetical protein
MTVALEKFENPTALAKRLEDILVKGSLYRVFAYVGYDCHVTNTMAMGSPCYGVLPGRLTQYCSNSKCEQDTQWENGSTEVYFSSPGLVRYAMYTCRNCGENEAHYSFIWQEQKTGTIFLKVGQYPPLTIEPSPELAKALGTEDTLLYKKALIDANYNHGLGAVAYFRRVLENKVNLILDLIAESLGNEQTETENLKHLEEVKNGRHIDKKIEFASKILPAHLKPGGHNPLDKLYAVASAGLHGESDDECVTIFNDARFVFEYLFKNLSVSNEEAREYVKRLSAPRVPKVESKTASIPVPNSCLKA